MIQLPKGYSDVRGKIQIIAHEHNGSIAVIESAPHVERANHYHMEDYHYCYIVYGCIHYYERKVGDTNPPKRTIFEKGSFFYTPPMMEHCMYFPEPTAFVTMGGKTRRQEDYEKDLVRVASLHLLYLENDGMSN